MATPTIRQCIGARTDNGPVTLNSGAGTAVGDVLVCFQGADWDTAGAMTTPTGTAGTWTVQATGDQGSNSWHLKIWTRAVTAGGAQTVTIPDIGSAENFEILYVLVGADTTTPNDGAGAGSQGAASTSQVAPAVSPVTADALLLCGAVTATANYTAPGGMFEDFEQDGDFSTMACASVALSASGSTGTKTFTSSVSSAYASASIAIKGVASATFVRPTIVVSRAAVQRAGGW